MSECICNLRPRLGNHLPNWREKRGKVVLSKIQRTTFLLSLHLFLTIQYYVILNLNLQLFWCPLCYQTSEWKILEKFLFPSLSLPMRKTNELLSILQTKWGLIVTDVVIWRFMCWTLGFHLKLSSRTIRKNSGCSSGRPGRNKFFC